METIDGGKQSFLWKSAHPVLRILWSNGCYYLPVSNGCHTRVGILWEIFYDKLEVCCFQNMGFGDGVVYLYNYFPAFIEHLPWYTVSTFNQLI